MSVQIIARDGEPEYAVLPWADYQVLLQAAGRQPAIEPGAVEQPVEAKRPALDQLRALREARGLAAESLARSVGISPHYLAMIESGERQPDAAILRSLAWELGLEGWS
ncbi:helix-turn-helix domain-containing protein [Ectopseudomonas alcaliphila]|uniref:helix-turn-helix domain-containing protein n=1 Tax=Ectopseudomonas alcaliphila TaxID=101564 RepID=UPI00277DB0F6|nr:MULTISPECIES: helix-turn-helix transcriptional regulator [Pseudomonas]MDP9939508.1 ribosome-binding protein aMBF1 (putative translation factor) [Pseudomonas sp. 3400]MDR7012925.1 ribosome-binding protein aMBF1 (putative translation factor) [Pseudomonas alcaliphila]